MPQPRIPPDNSDQRSTLWQANPPGPPTVVLGRYHILERIGGGGMGAVFRAFHVNLKQVVAIKTIRLGERTERQGELVDRFRREMEAVGAIQHPHVVRATDGGEEGGLYFLVMEYVEGIDLERLARELGPLGTADACELIRQAALGLACIHARGLVHRDIKPSNLLLSLDHAVKIADLGLARFRNNPGPDPDLTPEGVAVGTPDYLAPEQAKNARTADGRSDIYSLGCALFRLLAGQPPYPRPRFESYAEKLFAHQQEPIPHVQEVLAAAGHPLDPATPAAGVVLQRMMAKDPGDRFPDAESLLAVLTPLAAGSDLAQLWKRLQARELPATGLPGLAPPVGETLGVARGATPDRRPPVKAPPRPRRWPRQVALGSLTLLLAGALGLGASLGWFSPADSTDLGPRKNTSEPPAREVSLDLLPALNWHSLQEQPPRVIFWPQGDGTSLWHHDPGPKRLSLQSKGLGLLQFGQTTSPHYILRAGLTQSRWQGGIGLYLGGRFPDQEHSTGRLQFVQLRQERTRSGSRKLNVSRGFQELTRGKNGRLDGPATSVGSHPLSEVRGEQTLEITVGDGVLQQVRINGVVLRQLLTPDVNQHFTPADQTGSFGVIVNASEGIVRHAEFMRLNEAP
jgi:eukaryotic-like serine/threonine-protein kinase